MHKCVASGKRQACLVSLVHVDVLYIVLVAIFYHFATPHGTRTPRVTGESDNMARVQHLSHSPFVGRTAIASEHRAMCNVLCIVITEYSVPSVIVTTTSAHDANSDFMSLGDIHQSSMLACCRRAAQAHVCLHVAGGRHKHAHAESAACRTSTSA